MKNRFDFEQDIMQCWGIIDDLKMLIEQDAINRTTAEALTVLYDARFQRVWATFESVIKNIKRAKVREDSCYE